MSTDTAGSCGRKFAGKMTQTLMDSLYSVPAEPNEDSVALILDTLCRPPFRLCPVKICFEDEITLSFLKFACANGVFRSPAGADHEDESVPAFVTLRDEAVWRLEMEEMQITLSDARFQKNLERLRLLSSAEAG